MDSDIPMIGIYAPFPRSGKGEVAKILAMKSLPSADLKAMRSYKKLVNLA